MPNQNDLPNEASAKLGSTDPTQTITVNTTNDPVANPIRLTEPIIPSAPVEPSKSEPFPEGTDTPFPLIDESGESTPSMDIPSVISEPEPKKKFGGGKVIPTILGLLILVGGVGVGIILIKQPQNIENKAEYDVASKGGGACTANCNCKGCERTVTLTYNNADGTMVTRTVKQYVNQEGIGGAYVPTDGKGGLPAGIILKSNTIPGSSLAGNITATDKNGNPTAIAGYYLGNDGLWYPVGGGTTTSGDGDGGGGGGEITPTPTPPVNPTPTPTPPVINQCLNIKIFDTSWNEISTSSLSTLTAGKIVRFTVAGSPAASFDKAKFIINGTEKEEVTSKRPSTNEYYYEYTLPNGIINFAINAKLHLLVTGQWI